MTSTVLEHNYTRAYVSDEYMNYDWFYYLTPEQESEGWHTPDDFPPTEIEEFARFGAGEGEASGGVFTYHVEWNIDLLGNGNVRFSLSSYGNVLASLEMAMTSDWYIVETVHEEGSYKASIWVDGEAIPNEWMLEGSDAGIPVSSPYTMVFGFAELWRSNMWQVFWDWILVWDKVSGGEWGLGWVSEHPAIDDDWVTLRLSHPFTQGTARVDINGLRQMPDSYIEYPSSGAIVLDTELNPGDIVSVFYHIEDS